MKYTKALVAAAATVLSALVAAWSTHGSLSGTAWANVVFAGLAAVAVLVGPNVAGAPRTKALLAGAAAVATTVASMYPEGVSGLSLGQIAIAVVGALGVYLFPNTNKAPVTA